MACVKKVDESRNIVLKRGIELARNTQRGVEFEEPLVLPLSGRSASVCLWFKLNNNNSFRSRLLGENLSG